MNLFSCITQLRMKFIMLIDVKIPTIVGILTFISMINWEGSGSVVEWGCGFEPLWCHCIVSVSKTH